MEKEKDVQDSEVRSNESEIGQSQIIRKNELPTRVVERLNDAGLEEDFIAGLDRLVLRCKYPVLGCPQHELMKSKYNESFPMPIIEVDPEGGIIYANHNALELLDVEDLPVDAKIQDYVHKTELDKIREQIRNLYTTGPDDRTCCVETKFVKPNSEVRHFNIRCWIVSDTNNRYIRALMEDVTEKKLRDEEIEMGRRMDAVQRLAAGIAHDLNNQFAAMMGSAEMMEEEVSEKGKDDLRLIRQTIRESASLIAQLLEFSRQTKREMKKMDINDAVLQVKKLISSGARARSKSVSISMNLDSDFLVNADIVGLKQLIINLCLNGIDAMDDGGEITLRTKNVKTAHAVTGIVCDHVLLEVVDQGQGIPEEQIGRIFEPFFSTKQVDDLKGTGMGLAVVHGIVENLGGKIKVESKVGKGTVFKIYIPRVYDDGRDGFVEKNEIFKDSGTVLIIEDEDNVRKALTNYARKIGYEVLVAKNGREGIELFMENKGVIRGVVLDMRMPDMNGEQVFEQLRGLDEDVRVLVASGYGEHDDGVQNVLKKGGRGVLGKPFRLAEFSRKIVSILKKTEDVS
ncbi:response regulator [Candidatus Peregrinibacteria bacterium]|nr:response regulator [Candidatus Peregrinibacteria bacterium]